MQIIICLKLSHAQNSHLGAKKYPLSHSNSCKRGKLTHTLSHYWTQFWGPVGPHGSNPKFEPPVTPVSIWPTKMYKITVLLTFLDPEILRLKVVVTS